MKEILKRLEIIKSSIAIDDEEIIELQIIKLKKLDIDNDIENILNMLENLDYGSAMNDIENYIKRYTGVVEYVDSEVLGLKLELKSLEKKLQSLSQEKTEYLNDIEEFNIQYNIHLGDIIENILNLKKEILYKQTIKQQKLKNKYQEDTQIYEDSKDTIDEIKEAIKEFEELIENIDKDDESYDEIIKTYNDLKEELNNLEDDLISQEEQLNNIKEDLENDELFEEYEEAKASYDEFHNEYEDIKEKQSDRLELNDEDIKELKTLWKKACRLCHPDIVIDDLKEKANEIMQSLNDAYSKRDLKKVKQILLNLENGLVFEVSSDSIDNKEILKSKIEEFRQSIIDIEEEIKDIKSDDTFITISNLDDWDEYFEELKNELKSEEKKLEDKSRVILEEKKVVEDWIQNIWNWADEYGVSNNIISRNHENLKNTKNLDFLGQSFEFLPNELKYLTKLETLILWDVGIKYLPSDIVEITNLKKLNLRGNPNLSITQNQKEWLDELRKKSVVYSETNIPIVKESTLDVEDFFRNMPILNPIEKEATSKTEEFRNKLEEEIEYKFISNKELLNLLNKASEDEKLALSKIFDINKTIPYDSKTLQEMISKEGGNILGNTFRGQGTGYLDILDDVADALKINDIPSYFLEVKYYDEVSYIKGEKNDIPSSKIKRLYDRKEATKLGLEYATQTEEKIIVALIKKSYELIVKQKEDAEKKLLKLEKDKDSLSFESKYNSQKEEELDKDISNTKKVIKESIKRINDFDNSINEAAKVFNVNNLGKLTGTAGIMVLANLGGFATYTFLTSMMSVVSFGTLGFGAYTAATSLLSILIGPVGWAGLGIFAIFSLGKPNMSKLMPIVAIIGAIRQRIKYGKENIN